MRRITTLVIILFSFSNVLSQRAAIVTTDFSVGGLSELNTATKVPTNDLLLIHSDAGVQVFGDHVFIINRFLQDNIIVLSKEDLTSPITQYSTGNGTNPHEIAFTSSEKAYVTLYEKNYVLIVNPVTGDSLGTIDLSLFADADGLPEASQMALFGNHLFVAAQRLDREAFFSPTDFSVVVMIDTDDDTLVDLDPNTEGVQGIRLEAAQPLSHAHVQRGGKWILSSVGRFGTQDGGIEIVNLLTRTTEGISLPESTLGDDVGPITMWSDTEGYVVLTDADFVNRIVPFDLETETTAGPIPGHSGGFTQGLSVIGSELYVLDRGTFNDPTSVGVKVYDVTKNQLTAGPISTGLPPSAIAFLDLKASDFDVDGDVDFDDFLLFTTSFGKRQGDEGYASPMDLSLDGVINFSDFLVFVGQYR